MVNTTKGKHVAVETYDAGYSEFTGNGSNKDFDMDTGTPAISTIAIADVKYSRAYVDNEEKAIDAINTTTHVVTLVDIPANGASVVIHVPVTKNAAYSVQQDVRADIRARTEDIKELGNDVITRDVVERAGTLALTFAQTNNHNLITKLSANSRNDTEMVIAVKYKNTLPISWRIYKEAKVADIGSGATAGAVATETVTFNWKPPIEITT